MTVSSYRAGGAIRLPPSLKRLWRFRSAYLFVSPFYLNFLIFSSFPIVFAVYLSFQNWSGFGEMEPVGLGNYQRLLNDSRFWLSLQNTAILWLGHIFFLIALAFLLAVALNSRIFSNTGSNFYRTFIYLPNVTPIAIMALVFGFIFEMNFGILNSVLGSVGLPAVPWLADTTWAKISIILMNLWGATGWYMIILLAGLQSIDPTLYEAADIDGASGWQKMIYVMLPSVRGLLVLCFLIETIGSFQMFTEPYVLTSGGPQNGTLTTQLHMYNTAFEYNKLGYASAMSFALFAIIIVASLIQRQLIRDEEGLL